MKIQFSRLILSLFISTFLILSFQNCSEYKATPLDRNLSSARVVPPNTDSHPPANSAPVIQQFTASSLNLAAGGNTILTWSVSGATSLNISGYGDVTQLASLSITPMSSLSITLTATNSVGSVQKSLNITVQPAVPNAPSIDTFSANPVQINLGQSTTLNWSTSGATQLSLSGVGDVSNLNSKSVSPSVSTTYTLTASNAGGSVSKAVMVVVIAPPTIQSFTATPSSITNGDSSSLAWSVTNAAQIQISGIGDVTGRNSQLVSPTSTTSYTLTASNSAGSVTRTAQIEVTAAPSKPTINSFIVTPNPATVGQTVNVTWATTNATNLSITGLGDVTGKTSQSFAASASTTLVLTATNTAGSTTSSVNLTVNPANPNPPNPPSTNQDVQILFPPPSATSEAKIVVRGVVKSTINVDKLTVAGIAATSNDGFKTWKAEVPLNIGANTLQVDYVSQGQNLSNQASVRVDRFASDTAITRGTGNWAGRILALSYEPLKNRLIGADDVEDGVMQIDLATGNRKYLSASEAIRIGTGYAMVRPESVTSYNEQAFVVDDGLLARVNLINGNTDVFLPAQSVSSVDMTADATSLIVFTIKNGSEALLKVNAMTGTSTVIASNSVGTGTSLKNSNYMCYSPTNKMAYLGVFYSDNILAVNTETGARSVFSQATGSEPKFSGGVSFLTADDKSGQLFVSDGKILAAIDMKTGRRKLVSSRSPFPNSIIMALGATPWGPAYIDYYDNYGTGSGTPNRGFTIFILDPIEGTKVVVAR